jgi:MinD superfamily P-loop ATPase
MWENLIRQVKRHANRNSNTIVDASPGTSCPVVEAVNGSDFCVLVTEPTPFGLHDLRLAVEMLRKLAIPFGVVINCADIGDEGVERYCKAEDIPILMTIPWDRRIAEAYSQGVPLVEVRPEFREGFSSLYGKIQEMGK